MPGCSPTPRVEHRAAPPRPEGAQGCSHGCSGARVLAGAAQPVGRRTHALLRPGGAAEESLALPRGGPKYNELMSDATRARLNERLRRTGVPAAVPGSLPVLFFGDLYTARIATVGLNPSWQEYLSREHTELQGEKRRFETLDSLGAADRASLTDAQCERALHTMRDYFAPEKPVYAWFAGLSRVVEGFGASFRAGTAAHLDLVQESTRPVWSDVFKANHAAGAAMLDADLPFLRWQIEAFSLSTVICTSRTVLDNVVNITEAQRIDSGDFAGRHWTIARALVGKQETAVVGWNIPLARQPGLTREEQTELGGHLRSRLQSLGIGEVET